MANWKNKAFGQPVVSREWSSHCQSTYITFGLISVLTLQAWKKRWFVLRSGRLTGDPDVLEYYKNDHAKKPIRVIDLNLCEQVWSTLPLTYIRAQNHNSANDSFLSKSSLVTFIASHVIMFVHLGHLL